MLKFCHFFSPWNFPKVVYPLFRDISNITFVKIKFNSYFVSKRNSHGCLTLINPLVFVCNKVMGGAAVGKSAITLRFVSKKFVTEVYFTCFNVII
jgi:hypothetical protein